MKILIDILHPAHVHKLKNLIKTLEKDGHNVLITAREKDVTFKLLNAYGFTYKNLAKVGVNIPSLGKELLVRYAKLYSLCKTFKPDLLLGCSGTNIALISSVTNIPCVVLADTEDPKLAGKLGYYFADWIITTNRFQKNFGKKHIRFNSFLELAYLHPNNFTPDPTILDSLGVAQGEKYSIIRFVSWSASHDVFEKGFSVEFKKKLISKLSERGKVFISSEKELEPEFEKYKLTISPEEMHSALFYANFYVGDSQTMATEAGLLGTPSLRCNSLVGTMHGSGQFAELEKYGLVYSFKDKNQFFDKLESLLEEKQIVDVKKEWEKRREGLLKDKLDTTRFLVKFIKEEHWKK